MAMLKVNKRESTGKYVAFDLRKRGMLPGVIYGKGFDNLPLQLSHHDLIQLLHSGERYIELDIEGTTQPAIIKSLQHGNFGEEILHVDFAAVTATSIVQVEVSLEFKGEAAGIQDGGMVEESLYSVEIECQAKNLPESIVVDISDLKVDDVWYVKDLPKFEGITYVTAEDIAVVSCHIPMEVEEEPETPAEPIEGEAPEGEDAAAPAEEPKKEE